MPASWKQWTSLFRSRKKTPIRNQRWASLTLEELEPRILLANDYYLVPGTASESVRLAFDWTVRDAGYNNEIGVYAVQDAAGRVAGLLPTAAGYAAAVRANSQVVFTSGQGTGAHAEFAFAGGTRLAFYMVQNSTTVTWAGKNPNNQLNKKPVAFFSVDGASPDRFDHVHSKALASGNTRFYWEDMTGGGDRDFNDVIFDVGVLRDRVLHVPGEAGQLATATFTWDIRRASYNNELGIFRVDDASGRLGNLMPGDAGYATAALSSAERHIVFVSGKKAGAVTTLDLLSGLYGLYLVQNSTTAAFLAKNSSNSIRGKPLVFFGFFGANPDRFDHMRWLADNKFAFEDMTRGGDRDFDDLVAHVVFGTPRSVDNQPPVITAQLANDTAPGGLTNNDRLTANYSVGGTVTDDSRIVAFRARLDGSPTDTFFDVFADLQSNGSFLFSVARMAEINGGPLAQGQHVLRLQAEDEHGQRSTFALPFVLDSILDPLTLELDPVFDSAPVGDQQTTFATVTLAGMTEANAGVTLVETGAVTQADTSGRYAFAGIDLALGDNSFTVQATDLAGNQRSITQTFKRLETTPGFDDELSGWTPSEGGGSGPGAGTVTAQDGTAVLREGNSFVVSLQRTFTVPDPPGALSIEFDPLVFDTSSTGRMGDAFEAALVDSSGNPLVFTIASGRDAFFNITEGQDAVLATGVTRDGNRIIVNLANLAPGTEATLILRLVNNDGDENTTVRIIRVDEVASPGPVPAGVVPAAMRSSGAAPLSDFASLGDVSPSVQALYSRTSFNEDRTLLYADLALRNVGRYDVRKTLLVAIANLSDPSVHIQGADGVTPDGIPFVDFSRLLTNDTLATGDTSVARSIVFANPNRTQFTYNLVVLGQVNRPPEFTSTPDAEALVGKAYTYQTSASDPDQDALTYSLLIGPAGMSVDSASGRVTWNPTSADLGNQSVQLQVADNRGAFAVQTYTLAVINPPPNRPPVFTSTPVVDANVNSAYFYQATASDPDGTTPTDPAGDTLRFSLLDGPQGMVVDPASGRVAWTPLAAQLGTNSVTLQVDDGHGGTAQQSFLIAVQQATGNFQPVIVSQPVTAAPLGQTYQYPVRAIDPDNDVLTYALTVAPQGMGIDAGSGLITWSPPTAPGNALQFDGSGGYVSIGNRLNMGTSDFTLEAWIKGDPTMNSWGRILDKGYSDGYALGRFSNTNRVSFEFLNSGSLGSNFATTTDVIDNTWHQITVVKAGNMASLYADGILENTETVSAAAQNNTLPLLIGYNPGEGFQSHWKGQIDDVHIWTAARSTQDIINDINFSSDAHTSNLAAYWNFDEGQETIAHDATGNGNDGTLTGDGPGPTLPTWVASAAPIYATADAPVALRVDDGRGAFDTQSFTVHLETSPAGGIQGTKFNDLNANGTRDLVGGNSAPVTLYNVPGTSDPYLAGMAAGSTADGGDTAPAQAPFLVPGLTLTAGSSLMFTTLAGLVANGGGPTATGTTGPEGSTVTSHFGPQNGISNIVAPYNALLGVFLGADQPDGTAAPATLDFTSSGNVAGGFDYPALAPALKQVFFIGDGRTARALSSRSSSPPGPRACT